MTDFNTKIQAAAAKSCEILERKWKEESAQSVIKDFLNEVDEDTGKTNLEDILKAKKKLALGAKNELVALEAQKSFLKLAGGDEESSKGRSPNVFNPTIVVNPIRSEGKIIDGVVVENNKET